MGPICFYRIKSIKIALLISENIKIDLIKNLFLYARVLYRRKATKAQSILFVSKFITATNKENTNIKANLFLYVL